MTDFEKWWEGFWGHKADTETVNTRDIAFDAWKAAKPKASRYQFIMRVAERDRTGYYHTRWDLAQEMTVIATTRQEAMCKAEAVLGNPRDGRVWTFKFGMISEVPACPE